MTALAFVIASLATYGLTKIITETYIMRGFRSLFRSMVWEVFPGAMSHHMVRWFKNEDGDNEEVTTDEEDTSYDGREVHGYDMIACSFCVGFWVSIIFAILAYIDVAQPVAHLFAIYGVASFLATQER